MLTRRGIGAVIGAIALAAAGRVLGLIELFVLAAGVAALVVIGAVIVALRRPKLHATRHVEPARVHAGAESRVDLVVRNEGRARSPVVILRDSFDGGARQARFFVAPLSPGAEDRASYRLPADRRGRFVLGPLETHREDPLGLVSWKSIAGPATEMIVYPAIDQVKEMSSDRGQRAAVSHPTMTGPSGEDFANLRAYEVGDDLRQVHWPSTAKLDELMIRQLEHPREGHATVLLDLRRLVHDDESLERAVSAAASVIVACVRGGSLVRLVTTSGVDSGFGAGETHLDAIMDRLAVAEAEVEDHLAGMVAVGSRSRHGGPAAVISTDGLRPDDLAMIARLHTPQRRLAVVLFERAGAGENQPLALQRAGPSTTTVRVRPGEPFAAAWSRVVSQTRRRMPSAQGWG